MKRILILLAACGGGGSSAPTPDAGDQITTGTLTATWATKNVDGTPAACLPGYPTMKVTGVYWTKEFNNPEDSGMHTIGLFDCAAGTGTLPLQISGPVDGGLTANGKWDIRFEETDTQGETIVMTDLQSQLFRPVTVDLSGGTGTASTTFYVDGGYLWFNWALFGKTANDYLGSCAGAGVDKIDLELTNHDTQVVKHVMFPCDRSDGLTTGANNIEITEKNALGSGITPFPVGEWDYIATAYAGATVVGASVAGESTFVDPKNHITISADEAEILLTNR